MSEPLLSKFERHQTQLDLRLDGHNPLLSPRSQPEDDELEPLPEGTRQERIQAHCKKWVKGSHLGRDRIPGERLSTHRPLRSNATR